MERQKYGEEPPDVIPSIFFSFFVWEKFKENFMDCQSHSVQGAPDNESQTRTVPQTAKQHRGQKIDVREHRFFSVFWKYKCQAEND